VRVPDAPPARGFRIDSAPMSKTYSFQDVQIAPAHRELRRGGKLVDLPPHVFDFLVYLLERHDRAVSRDELVAAVWGKTEVSDTVLGQTVLRARRELGDDAKNQQVLRTIPRFGYRWVAPLDIVEAGAPPAGDALAAQADERTGTAVAAHETERRAPRKRLWGGVALASALLLIGVLLVRGYDVMPPRRPAPHGDLSSAVLPAQLQAETQWAWLRLAVMDVVAGRLRSSGVPSVPSEDVISLLRTPSSDIRGAIRNATTASLLLLPKIHRNGDAWVVTLEADNGDGRPYTSTAQAADALAAAREATDRLLLQFGLYAQDGRESIAQSALVRRLDAAILADDPVTAKALIADAPAEMQGSAEVRLRLAKIDFRSGHFDAARTRLQGLLDEAAPGDAALRGSILNGLGSVAIRENRQAEADVHFSQAIEILSSGGDPQQLGQAYLGRGNVAAEQGRPDEAMADYARARNAFRAAADPLALARVAANEGFLDLGRDRPADALPPLRKAAGSFRDWGALNEAIYASIGAISANLALLDNAAAMQVADAAAELDRRIDNADTHASLALARVRALIAVGRFREARETLQVLHGTNKDDENTIAMADGLLARLELEQRHPAAAAELAGRAQAALTGPGDAGMRSEAWLTQLRAALQEPDEAHATAILSAFEAWAETVTAARARFHARLARAEYAARFAAADEWHRRFEAARSLAEQGGVPVEIAAAARGYATALIAHAELDAAAVEIERVSRWSDGDFACALLEAQLHAALGDDAERESSLARARALAGERSIPATMLPLSPPSGLPSNGN
jgi:DNA-binding winged helix-turn-helix (wHTH) protein/tetratricopeptide (TPR) repeat protein